METKKAIELGIRKTAMPIRSPILKFEEQKLRKFERQYQANACLLTLRYAGMRTGRERPPGCLVSRLFISSKESQLLQVLKSVSRSARQSQGMFAVPICLRTDCINNGLKQVS